MRLEKHMVGGPTCEQPLHLRIVSGEVRGLVPLILNKAYLVQGHGDVETA